MLNIKNKIFHGPFHNYFDRNDNFHCYVNFNIYQFIKHYSSFPQIYDNEQFWNNISNLILFDFYLVSEIEEQVTNTQKIKKINFQDVETINLYDSNRVLTFHVNTDTSNLRGKYLLKGVVRFQDKFYEYLKQFLSGQINDVFLGLDKNIVTYKAETIVNSFDKKYINQFKPLNLPSTYEFVSDYINFVDRSIKIINLGDSYRQNLTLSEFNNFIQINEKEREKVLDGVVPLTSCIIDNVNSPLTFNVVTKQGSIPEYLNLSMSILDKMKNRENYVNYNYGNNLFINNQTTKSKRKEERKSYEAINSIQSTACEDTITYTNELPKLAESKILFISTFFDNFSNILIDNYWAENPEILPAYLFDIVTRFNIFYLSDFSETNMKEKWNQLTKENISNLNKKRYLCKITTDNLHIQDNLIENYFVLEI